MLPCVQAGAAVRKCALNSSVENDSPARGSAQRTNYQTMNDFERQSRRAADQEILSDEVAEEISKIPTEVIDIADAPQLAPPAPLDKRDVRAILMSLLLTMFLAALEQTIVATALPTLGRQFGDVTNLSWVITAYLL